jgi:ABC-type glycerol-3-phosphate transport system substrate-binding protein
VKSVGVAVKQLFDTKNVYGKLLGSDGNVYSELPKGVTLVFDAKQVTAENFHLLSYDSTENLFITLVRQFGGHFTEVDPKETGKGYAVFADANNKEKTLAAMAMFRDLGKAGAIAIPASYNESLYCSTPFKNGQSLLNIGSTGGLSNAVGSFTVHANPIPQNGDSQAKFVIGQGTNLALFNKGSDKEKVAAWKLMVYLAQQANGRFAAETGYFPTCEDATNSKEYQDYLESSADAKGMITIECGRINKEVYGNKEDGWVRFVDPAFLGSSAVRQECGYIPGYIISGEVGTNQQILDAVYKKLPDFTR